MALADRAVAIGPAPATESYLSIPRIIDAARATSADAIHPGYGFLSENHAFAEACSSAGIAFVGPPGPVLLQMGSKLEARRIAESADVPVVPGETPDDQSDEGVRRSLERVGVPAMVKASAGGGGKGMRRIDDSIDAAEAIQSARREAVAAFGDGTLYVERLIERPHHVEVQVFADANGRVVHLFERECSTQRRHQKIIEESPSPNVPPALRRRMTDAAVRIARAASYRNAGTVEFLVDLAGRRQSEPAFYFLEVNARLQVEHPVTEQITGIDLVRVQILIAAGAPLPHRQEVIAFRGHALECRLNAQHPYSHRPSPGKIDTWHLRRGPGERVRAAGGAAPPVSRAARAGNQNRFRRSGRRSHFGLLRSAHRESDRLCGDARRIDFTARRRAARFSSPRHPDQHSVSDPRPRERGVPCGPHTHVVPGRGRPAPA